MIWNYLQFLPQDFAIQDPNEIFGGIALLDENWRESYIPLPQSKIWNTTWHGSCVSLLFNANLTTSGLLFSLKSKEV